MKNPIKILTASHLRRSFLTTLFGSGGARAISVLTTFIIARILTQDDFGQFSFVRNTLEMILSICALNFSSLATKYTTEISNLHNYSKLSILFLFSFFICAIIGLLLLILPEKLLLGIFINREIIYIFRFVGVLLPLLFIAPLIQGIYRGLFDFKFVAKVQIIENLFFLVIAILGILWKGIIGALFSIVVYYVFRSLIVLLPLLRRVNVKKILKNVKDIINHKYILGKEILPMFFLSFVEAPVFWLAQLLLTQFGGFEFVASMTVILQIRNLILIIPSYFFNTFLSFASKLYSDQEYRQYYKKIDGLMSKIFLISLILTIIICFLGKFLLGCFGPEYISSFGSFILGALPIPILIIISLLKIHMVIKERQKNLLFISLFWNAFWIVSFFIFLKLKILTSLNAFFMCQDIAVLVNLTWLYYYYNKDKREVINYEEIN